MWVCKVMQSALALQRKTAEELLLFTVCYCRTQECWVLSAFKTGNAVELWAETWLQFPCACVTTFHTTVCLDTTISSSSQFYVLLFHLIQQEDSLHYFSYLEDSMCG